MIFKMNIRTGFARGGSSTGLRHFVRKPTSTTMRCIEYGEWIHKTRSSTPRKEIYGRVQVPSPNRISIGCPALALGVSHRKVRLICLEGRLAWTCFDLLLKQELVRKGKPLFYVGFDNALPVSFASYSTCANCTSVFPCIGSPCPPRVFEPPCG